MCEQVAAQTASPFNPNVRITPIHDNIKEPQYDIPWFQQFDIVLNALDNLGLLTTTHITCCFLIVIYLVCCNLACLLSGFYRCSETCEQDVYGRSGAAGGIRNGRLPWTSSATTQGAQTSTISHGSAVWTISIYRTTQSVLTAYRNRRQSHFLCVPFVLHQANPFIV